MNDARSEGSILIVDDEAASPLVSAVRRGLEKEGWATVVVEPEEGLRSGDEFEAAALYAIEESRPDGVLLDVRFGCPAESDHRADVQHGRPGERTGEGGPSSRRAARRRGSAPPPRQRDPE